jgi:hypothetical protein
MARNRECFVFSYIVTSLAALAEAPRSQLGADPPGANVRQDEPRALPEKRLPALSLGKAQARAGV